MKPFLDSTDVVDDADELRRRCERDGYLFIRDLLPPVVLEDLRRKLLEVAREGGWLRHDTPLADAIADPDGFCAEPQAAYLKIYSRIYQLQDLHALMHHPNLMSLLEGLLGAPVLPHPSIISRTIFPQREAYTTPAHQDFVPIQGTPDTYTAWIPLTNLPPEMGGLQLAAGSHLNGVYDFQPATGAGGTEVIDPLDGCWVHNPMNQGDVLIFHSMTVHKGVTCHGDRLRMSVDARYQRIGDPIAEGSLTPHTQEVQTWDEIYADWPDDRYQYYWRDYNLTIKEYDNQYYDKRDRLAFELAATGDERARGALDRIVARDPDSAKQQQAREMLAKLDLAEGSGNQSRNNL